MPYAISAIAMVASIQETFADAAYCRVNRHTDNRPRRKSLFVSVLPVL